jgi:glycine reductase
VAQITPIPSVAKTVGPNRIVRGQGIVCPVGDTALPAGEELELRRRLVRQALDALSSEAG